VLTAQALLTALLPAALLLLVTRVAGHRAGLAAGVLAALSPPLGYHASIVTPDALTALLAVLAVLPLGCARAARGAAGGAWLAAAGLTVGIATWLRPNFLLLGPVLALAVPFLLPTLRRPWARAAVMVTVASPRSP
jgi:4-amino-4-deoxy-L-arabinose transferase-like glycosyltransferase